MKNKNKSKKQYSPDDFLNKGIEAMQAFEPELAYRFFKRALSIDPNNEAILDNIAEVCIQLGMRDEALDYLSKSINESSNQSYTKWLTLAQLQTGLEALASFQKAVSMIKLNLESNDLMDEEKCKVKTILSQAYASIAELYLTDLCFECDAETNCEYFVNKSLEVDSTSLDGLQALANLRVSQKNIPEASLLINEVYHKTIAKREAYRKRTVIEDLTEAFDGNKLNDSSSLDIPTNEFSIQTAKILIECSNEINNFSFQSIQLLTDLLDDDDENIEIWYIIGVASLSCHPPEYENAKAHLERAKEMMETLYSQLGPENFPYTEQIRLVEEHLSIVNNSFRSTSHDQISKSAPNANQVNNSDFEEDCDEEWSTEEELDT